MRYVCIILFFALFAEWVLGFSGESFVFGASALLILLAGRFYSSICGSVGSILQMTGNQNIYGVILFFGAIINVVLNLFLIPENNPFSVYGISGINGAATASMCSLSFWNLSMVFVVKKKFGFYSFYIPFLSHEK